jgi:hypothetical protein
LSYVIPLWLGLLIIPATDSPQAERARPAFQVFADFDHTGKLSGPLNWSPQAGKDFVIVAPLPARGADRGLVLERAEADETLLKRLGRLRVETTKGGGDVDVSIESENRRWLRLFRKSDDGWRRVAPSEDKSWTLAPGGDRTLELGVGVVFPEANSAGPQAAWPREFTVVLSTKAERTWNVRVPFRVAPYIIPSALEPVEELLIVSLPLTADSVRSVAAFAAKSGLKLDALEANLPCDQWMQDAIEPGVFAFPTAVGPEQARAALAGIRKESRRSAARLDYQVARRLRRQGVVTVVPGLARKQSRWIDWYGNLEATPPYTDRQGHRFPYGRLITGKQGELTMHPDVMRFLEAQGVQWPPIVVDTSWLAIGHVDEVVNFVPAKSRAGFKVLLPSPKAARELLDSLVAQGMDEVSVFAGTEDEITVVKLRMTVAGASENLAIDDAVERIRTQLKTELNLDDADFVMVPALFRRGMAVIPNPVNSLVVNGHLLVPQPRGPRQDEKDRFEVAIRESLAGCDVRLVFIDTWQAYHSSGGEIHCGTNAFRRLRDPAWWTRGFGGTEGAEPAGQRR